MSQPGFILKNMVRSLIECDGYDEADAIGQLIWNILRMEIIILLIALI